MNMETSRGFSPFKVSKPFKPSRFKVTNSTGHLSLPPGFIFPKNQPHHRGDPSVEPPRQDLSLEMPHGLVDTPILLVTWMEKERHPFMLFVRWRKIEVSYQRMLLHPLWVSCNAFESQSKSWFKVPLKEGKIRWTVTDSPWRVYWRSIQTMSWWILWTNRINAPTLMSLITLNNRNHDIIILYLVAYPSFTPSPPNQNLAMSLQRAKTLALHRI